MNTLFDKMFIKTDKQNKNQVADKCLICYNPITFSIEQFILLKRYCLRATTGHEKQCNVTVLDTLLHKEICHKIYLDTPRMKI